VSAHETWPAHKFTRLTDFKDLLALSRNFLRPARPAASMATPAGKPHFAPRTQRFAPVAQAIEMIGRAESAISRFCVFSMV